MHHSRGFNLSLQHPQPFAHLRVLKHYLIHSILEGLKGQKIRQVTLQVVQGQILAGKSMILILHLWLFLNQLHQFILVNYSSELLHEINKFIKSKLLVLKGYKSYYPQYYINHKTCAPIFLYVIYMFAKYNFTSWHIFLFVWLSSEPSRSIISIFIVQW